MVFLCGTPLMFQLGMPFQQSWAAVSIPSIWQSTAGSEPAGKISISFEQMISSSLHVFILLRESIEK